MRGWGWNTYRGCVCVVYLLLLVVVVVVEIVFDLKWLLLCDSLYLL